MKIGLQIPHFRPSSPSSMQGWLQDVAQTADQGGFDSIWLMDHFIQLGEFLGPPDSEMLEGYAALGYIAGVTQNMKLGLLVGGVIYRHPAIVVKSISTLDVLSGGRTYFGIGAAWYDLECDWLGLPFPPTKTRFEILEEALLIAHQMFHGDDSPFEGKYFTLQKPWNNPQPLQDPHPPILIGGMGPKKTLKLVAKYGDACNFFGSAPTRILKQRLDVLKQHCADEGRDYDEIEKTVLYDEIDIQPGVDKHLINKSREFAKLGFNHIILNLNSDYTPDNISYLADRVLPEIKTIE